MSHDAHMSSWFQLLVCSGFLQRSASHRAKVQPTTVPRRGANRLPANEGTVWTYRETEDGVGLREQVCWL
jgi:hypothetical protein